MCILFAPKSLVKPGLTRVKAWFNQPGFVVKPDLPRKLGKTKLSRLSISLFVFKGSVSLVQPGFTKLTRLLTRLWVQGYSEKSIYLLGRWLSCCTCDEELHPNRTQISCRCHYTHATSSLLGIYEVRLVGRGTAWFVWSYTEITIAAYSTL